MMNDTPTTSSKTTTGNVNDRRMSTRFLYAENAILEKMPSLHEHKHPKILVRVTFLLCALNTLLFAVWILTTPYGYPWFIHPIYVSALATAIFLILGSNAYPNKFYSIHVAFFFFTSFMLIIINEHTPSSYPWAIYPVGVFTIAITIHTLFVSFPDFANHFYIHLIFYCVTNLMLFVTYCYNHERFPWFLIPLGVWFALVFLHFVIWKVVEKRRQEKVNNTMATIPSTTTEDPFRPPQQYSTTGYDDLGGAGLDYTPQQQPFHDEPVHTPLYPAPSATSSQNNYTSV
jgi:hypothetical protein